DPGPTWTFVDRIHAEAASPRPLRQTSGRSGQSLAWLSAVQTNGLHSMTALLIPRAGQCSRRHNPPISLDISELASIRRNELIVVLGADSGGCVRFRSGAVRVNMVLTRLCNETTNLAICADGVDLPVSASAVIDDEARIGERTIRRRPRNLS